MWPTKVHLDPWVKLFFLQTKLQFKTSTVIEWHAASFTFIQITVLFFIKLNFSTIISICTYLFTVMISAGVSGPWTWVSAHKEAVNECVQATAAVRQWRWTYKHGCLAVMTLYTDLMIPTLHRNLWGRHNYSPTLFGVDCRKNWRLLLKLSNIEW